MQLNRAFLISLLVFVLDQTTKYVVKANISPYRIIEVLPFFNIVYVENIGSAFGMFKSLGNFFFIVIAAAAMVFVTVLIIKDKDNRLAFSLILGGAAGNFVDRVIHGYVIDFLDFYIGRFHWPAFNVADSALTIGIMLLTVKLFFDVKKSDKVQNVS
ncbi:MAG: signal peptidase II [Nitrospirae bacterium GWC2_46_6]|nr:MAG: signal peptidase II [Nitrospirae bacterium GWA2_46_11]OGW22197.1 MAG: signal peptidase II [Nitrospirae bacterium GWC2_46_6]OGW26127.1 MAG: signal peptidase II [Nitrospirae bacterium GWB2_47_37]HAK89415.1 signal peptidase II [Nitrospiraceae bacterium]HCL80902.1 signal peptidase II [Nitrospiraceae bacterium]